MKISPARAVTVVRELAAIAAGSQLTELELTLDALHVRLLRTGASAPPAVAGDRVTVDAPLTGRFHRGAPEDGGLLAREGDAVAAGDPVALLESCGRLVEVMSPVAGELLEVLVEDGQAVERGRALFSVAPTPK